MKEHIRYLVLMVKECQTPLSDSDLLVALSLGFLSFMNVFYYH